MADNYLEKKMEDLRMGKTGASAPRRRLSPGAGRICFDFPPRRVLVAGGCHGIGEAIVDAYLHAGCKVAVFDTDKDKGSAMARDKGIRYHNVDTTDCSELEKNMTGLLKAWRDIDIIVGCTSASECLSHLADIWLSHKQRYPIPSDYGGRIIDICESNSVPATDAIDSDVIASLNGLGINVNVIRSDTKKGSEIASLCLLLSLPLAGGITTADI